MPAQQTCNRCNRDASKTPLIGVFETEKGELVCTECETPSDFPA
jgi:hypothetical protein